VLVWMKAVAHRTTLLLLAAVSSIPALSPLGAKQLAADVSYLANIFAAGLSLPQVISLHCKTSSFYPGGSAVWPQCWLCAVCAVGRVGCCVGGGGTLCG